MVCSQLNITGCELMPPHSVADLGGGGGGGGGGRGVEGRTPHDPKIIIQLAGMSFARAV